MDIDDCNILIGTPAYNGNIHTEYLHAALAFKTAGINFAIQTISNESLITRARNTLINSFWEKEEFTHLLFLDADVFLDVNGLRNMIYYNKDVIGAPVALKGKNKDGGTIWNTDIFLDVEPGLQSVTFLGTAVFMLSRHAVSKLIEDAEKNNNFYSTQSQFISKEECDPKRYDIFQVGVVDNRYLSEDYWVCHKLRQLGFEILVDTSIITRHSGVVAFD